MSIAPALTRFAPPATAAQLYRGQVMHARMKPKVHRFNYSVFTLLIDVGRLEDAHRTARLFSVNCFNLFSFREADHGPQDGSSLFAHVCSALMQAGLAAPPARVMLLCYPRVLGHTFNPISVYYAYDGSDQLTGIIYEVRNTFGDMHTYVCPLREGELSEAGLRQMRAKLFYVSPFMDMPMTYHFRLRPPSEDIAVRILETDEAGPILSATFHGHRTAMTSASILGAFLSIPLMTLKVVSGIHYEAMKLWFKGMRFYSRPEPPPPLSVDGHFVKSKSMLESRT
jgi:uncharacterized protein